MDDLDDYEYLLDCKDYEIEELGDEVRAYERLVEKLENAVRESLSVYDKAEFFDDVMFLLKNHKCENCMQNSSCSGNACNIK
jgi:hypothetical protein